MIHALLAPWSASKAQALVEQGEHTGWSFQVAASGPQDRPWLDWLATRAERPRWFIGQQDGSFRLGLGACRGADPRTVEYTAAGVVLWPCFSEEPADPDWGPLARPALLVPRFLLESSGKHLRLEWRPRALPTTADAALEALLEWLDPRPCPAPAALPPIVGRCHSPRADWDRGVARILAACDTGLLEKAVLARWHELELATAPDPLDLLRLLPPNQATRLFVEHESGPAFLALSPECLFRREGQRIRCDALAGTRPAGGAGPSDLAGSAKDRHEQALVVRGLQQDLQQAGCERIQVGPVSTDRAASLVHLRSTVQAEWGPDTIPDDLGLVSALHPSPALGGRPRRAALDLLTACEPFSRGLFGGLLGYLTRQQAVFHVGIRCARLLGNRLRFYAGAGIVPGSEAAAEWQETADKLAVLQHALGLAPGGGNGEGGHGE